MYMCVIVLQYKYGGYKYQDSFQHFLIYTKLYTQN